MDREELEKLRGKVRETAENLYQNKAAVMQEIPGVLMQIQQVGNQCVEIDDRKQFEVIRVLQKLIEGYQMADVLQLGDVLFYEVTDMIDFCVMGGQ